MPTLEVDPPSSHTPSIKTTRKIKKDIDPKQLYRYRLMILGRFILAIIGGYVFSVSSMALLPKLFANEVKAHAVLLSMMLSFVVYGAVFIWVFLVQSTRKAWLGVIVPSIVFCTILYFI